MNENYFITTEVLNRTTILKSYTLENHMKDHPEIGRDLLCIQKTIEDPDKIFYSSKSTSCEVYFKKGANKYYYDKFVKVVVTYKNPQTGYVKSCWLQEDIRGGIGGLKYEKKTTV